MQQEQLTGLIDRFLFQNSDNGFTVLVLQTRGTNTTLVKGILPNLQPGQQVTFTGTWIVHPKFGKQFEAQSCTACLPTNIAGLKKYLGSGLIKGIGPVYAEKLVDKFGTAVLDIIENKPERLTEVGGIGPKRIEQINAAWKDQKEIANIMIFLQDKGVSTTYATKIYKKYGQSAISIIQENPYKLTDDIWGIGFKKADEVAQNLGFEKESLKRISSGLLFAIKQQLDKGHIYIELSALKQNTVILLELLPKSVEQKVKIALHSLFEQDRIKLISKDDQHFITLPQYYYAEKGLAEKIKTVIDKPTKHTFNLDKIYNQLRTGINNITLNDEQQEGIMTCLQNKITIITGGPGTGKTTLIKSLLSILEENNTRYKLAAPTGRAAKRINEGTGRHAETIHRLLAFDFNTMGFAHNENNALQTDFLIIDEASMIDVFLANSLLKATSQDTHILFIGDIHQLPSVGSGNFLNDLISSNITKNIKLSTIFRQAQDSMIITNAHRINSGEFPLSFLPEAKRDYFFIKEDDPVNIPTHLNKIYTKGLQKFGIKKEDSIVLVPMHRGSAGTQKLNYDLQNIINPTSDEKTLSYAGTLFKIGDRIMQLRNNYDKKIFNGDTGIIVDIETKDKILFVRFNNNVIEYASNELNEIVLAYAISIHKSQGSEYAAAIIPLFTQHFTLLQRNLIYTAVTRAKKLCIIIGQSKAIAMAIKNNKSLNRMTFLEQYLTSSIECR